MRCAKAKRHLALLFGNDLSRRKGRALDRHLSACPDCRKELQEYKAALAGLKAIARNEERDWEEPEWKNVIAVAIDQDIPLRRRPFIAKPKIAWAYGMIMILALGAAALITRNIIQKPGPVLSSEIIAPTPAESSRQWNLDGREAPRRLQDRPLLAKTIPAEDAGKKPALPGISEKKDSQDILSVTLVSQSTGLRVYWTFDRNFDWKEEKP